MKNSIKVAGVTFKNEDGVKRQDILSKLNKNFVTCKLSETRFLNKENGSLEKAIQVFCNKQLIGWIPKKDLNHTLAKSKTLTGYVDCYKEKYHVLLSKPEAPDSKAYREMKSICQAQRWAMPPYDKRAYAQVFAYLQQNNIELAFEKA